MKHINITKIPPFHSFDLQAAIRYATYLYPDIEEIYIPPGDYEVRGNMLYHTDGETLCPAEQSLPTQIKITGGHYRKSTTEPCDNAGAVVRERTIRGTHDTASPTHSSETQPNILPKTVRVYARRRHFPVAQFSFIEFLKAL
jgi:hypothetical protein